jgi:hypothetical protein
MPVKVKMAVESRECAFYRMGLTDLVAKEGKDVLDTLVNACKVSLGLEDRLRRQTESTARATSIGTDRLKPVKALSEERAGDYKKCIDI